MISDTLIYTTFRTPLGLTGVAATPVGICRVVFSISSERDFAEMLKTQDSGQFSFFTAKPGVTRGGHYHHTKTEKFLVVSGKAKFQFRNIISNESFEILSTSEELKVVETVPGWAHSITNIGKDEIVVMLWANEIFDPDNPDTINHET